MRRAYMLRFRGLSVCLCVGHDCEPCENGPTDRDDFGGQTRLGRETVYGECDGSICARTTVRSLATTTVAMCCFGC